MSIRSFPSSRRTQVIACAECRRAVDCLGAMLEGGSAASCMTRGALAKGDHLYRSDDPVDFIYVVSSGALKTYAVSPDGAERVLGFHLPGDVIGIDSVTNPRYLSSVVALARSRVCRMPAGAIRRRVEESAEFREQLVIRMGREIQRLHRMLHLSRRTAEQRVASFLVSQARKLEAEGFHGRSQRLPMSRADIGRFLGLASETISRVFARLRSSGVLTVRRDSVEIRNVARLVAMVQGASPRH